MNTVTTQEFEALFNESRPLLDVRAPVEFGAGSFPTAVNIPLLTDQQRHEVGIAYKHSGKDSAIALGHELVCGAHRDNLIERWREFVRANPEGCLYCFRGGLRSRTVQAWLAESGIDYPLVAGGYKALRRYLIDQLQNSVDSLNMVIVAGRTGSGKTLLLERLDHKVDLENLAKHRGSSFGALLDPQPTNIDFENQVSIELLRKKLQQAGPVFLEDEGKIIGSVCMPEPLRHKMQTLPMVILEAPLEERIKVSIDAYILQLLGIYQIRFGEEHGFDAMIEHHRHALSRIRKRFGGLAHDETLRLLENAAQRHKSGDLSGYEPYISKLLTEYYDPMYDYQIARKHRPVLFRGSSDEIVAWADTVVGACEGIT